MADGRRNTVDGKDYYIIYILNNSTAEVLLSESALICSNNIFKYLGNDVSSITDFRLYRKASGEDKASLIVRAGLADPTKKTAATASYIMIYPSAYILNEDSYQQKVLDNLAYISADSVLGYDDRAIEKCSKYGIYTNEDDVERIFSQPIQEFRAGRHPSAKHQGP